MAKTLKAYKAAVLGVICTVLSLTNNIKNSRYYAKKYRQTIAKEMLFTNAEVFFVHLEQPLITQINIRLI